MFLATIFETIKRRSDNAHFDMPNYEKTLRQRYQVGNRIGGGVSGSVFQGKRISDALPVALKVIRKNSLSITNWKHDRNLGTTVPMEIFLLKRLNHPNIVKYVDTLEDAENFYLITELCGFNLRSMGYTENVDCIQNPKSSFDLFDYVDSNDYTTEANIVYIFKQIADAVLYLHQNNIVHRDIKDENIVIDSDLNAKLVDFGVSERIPSTSRDYFVSFRGSLLYTAPELLKYPRHRGPEVDIWCLGVVLHIMAFGGHPFPNLESIGQQRYLPTIINRSDALQRLISRMLDPNPNTRATISEVVKSDFLNM
jgi:serine/threonine protein kinase